MGERQVFQPLTKEDKVTVVLYRIGIVLSTIITAVLAILFLIGSLNAGSPLPEVLGYGLQVSVGMSVFFIHLYLSTFKKYLKNLYYISLACLAALVYLGKGSLSLALVQTPVSALLLLPLSGCLGFVTAKEAFCFKLLEGYVLAMVMPFYLLLLATGSVAGRSAVSGLAVIALLLVLFTLRKAFMPLAYDIGDKSAYR
ncbi:MAG: DUF2301 domain-containing membrane protein [Nitrospirota bacterium]|nr:DUF2301 domain-containing membrane protein [Nitrospirota bacterium]